VPAVPFPLDGTAVAPRARRWRARRSVRLSEAARLGLELTSAGLITAQEIVDDRISIHVASRKNRNLVITGGEGDGRFIKLGSPEDPTAPSRESERLLELRRHPELLASLPAPLDDAPPGTLVIAAEPGARDLWAYHAEEQRFPPAIGAAVGRALGRLHRVTRSERSPEPVRPPWVLSMHRPRVAALQELTPAGVTLVETVQGRQVLTEGLDALHESWVATATIHGDVTWANILVGVRTPDGIRLIDWEHAGPGEPAWDAGSVLASHLVFWVHAGAGITDDAADQVSLDSMEAAAQAFWAEYCAAAAEARDDDAVLVQAMRFAAARLVQSADESAWFTTILDRRMIAKLQLAENIFKNPLDAASDLFGIGRVPR
jgi:hypothetical protein